MNRLTIIHTAIAKHLSRYHAGGRQVTVVFVTREPEVTLRAKLGVGIQIRTLFPMCQTKSQKLFRKLCKQAGVQLSKHDRKFIKEKAFSSADLRVPLFVAICAFLLPTDRSSSPSLEHILQMKTSELFERYIGALYSKSGPSNLSRLETRQAHELEVDFKTFRQILLLLAVDVWPMWKQNDDTDVEHKLKVLLVQNGLPEDCFSTKYLVENGFMVRDVINSSKIGFAHQAMADYLAAMGMAYQDDFSKLSDGQSRHRLEDIRAMLAEVVRTPQKLRSLCYGDLEGAVEVLRGWCEKEMLPGRMDLMIGEPMARWARDDAPYAVGRGVWADARKLLDCLDEGKWINQFLESIRTQPRRSPKAVAALSRVGYREAEAQFARWLLHRENHNAFVAATRRGEVRAGLSRIMMSEKLKRNLRQPAFEVLWEVAIAAEYEHSGECQAVVDEYFLKVLNKRMKSDFEWLVFKSMPKEQRDRILACLGRLAMQKGETTRRWLAELTEEMLNAVLMGPGSYQVEKAGGGSQTVSIDRPLKVPWAVNEKNVKRYRSLREAEGDMSKVKKSLMDIGEARVLFQYYGNRWDGERGGMGLQERSRGFLE